MLELCVQPLKTEALHHHDQQGPQRKTPSQSRKKEPDQPEVISSKDSNTT